MRAPAAAFAALAALTACKRDSSLYCDQNDLTCPAGYYCEPGNHICIELVDGAMIPCDPTHPCSEPLPFCLDGLCAECGGDPDCDDNPLPVCGPDNTCIACTIDDDCDSEVCLFDGTCADAGNVIYTDPGGGATGPCDIAAPCDLDYGVGMVNAVRNIVHLAPGEHDTITSIDPALDATLIGRGARIRYTGGPDDNVIEIDGNAGAGFKPLLQIYYVEIFAGRGSVPQGSGIRCQDAELRLRGVTIRNNDNSGIYMNPCDADLQDVRVHNNDEYGLIIEDGILTIADSTIYSNTSVGVVADFGSNLTVRRSIIRNNVGGGFDLNGGPHVIENSLITSNVTTGQIGGVRFGFGPHTFRFNTVANNDNGAHINTGVICADTWPGSSNLFDDPVSGNCEMNFSLFTVGAGTPVNGANNVLGVVDPLFIETDPMMPGYYHVEGGSPAVNAAEPIVDVTDDVDRELRPSQSNPARDIGADETP